MPLDVKMDAVQGLASYSIMRRLGRTTKKNLSLPFTGKRLVALQAKCRRDFDVSTAAGQEEAGRLAAAVLNSWGKNNATLVGYLICEACNVVVLGLLVIILRQLSVLLKAISKIATNFTVLKVWRKARHFASAAFSLVF